MFEDTGVIEGTDREIVASKSAYSEIVGLDFREPRYWLALFCMGGKEQGAANRLKELNVRAYWPNFSSSEVIGRREHPIRRKRLRALIPGYIFVAVRQDAVLDPAFIIDEISGLFGYMRDGTGVASHLTEHDISRIRQIETDHNMPPPKQHAHHYRIGQKVRFKIDSGMQGQIIAFDIDGRISIEAKRLLGGATVRAWPHQIESM